MHTLYQGSEEISGKEWPLLSGRPGLESCLCHLFISCLAFDRFLTSLSFSFLIYKNENENIYGYQSKPLLEGAHPVKISRLMIKRKCGKCDYGNICCFGIPVGSSLSFSFLIHQMKGWNRLLLKSEQPWHFIYTILFTPNSKFMR